MKNREIIKNAVLSEKAYLLMEKSVYTFMVEKKASKEQIKKAVENQFSTKVKKVRVSSVSQKTKRVTGTRKSTMVGGGKKAIVYLEKGQSIAMLSPKSEKKESKKITKESKGSDESKDTKKGLLSKIRKPKAQKEEVGK